MKFTSRFQTLHVIFHVPAALAEQALADWAFAEVARHHAPDLAPQFAHIALTEIAPYATAVSAQTGAQA